MKIKTWRGIKVEERLARRTSACHIYRVTLLEGDWPSDRDLITLCDSSQQVLNVCQEEETLNAVRSHFGGQVEKTSNEKVKVVHVWVD